MSSCRGPKCGCTNYIRRSTLSNGWVVCATCFHCEQTHVFKDNEKVVIQKGNEMPEPEAKPVKLRVKSKPYMPVVSQSVDGDLTPKAMRAWLISQGVAGVGERGRLKPEHIAMATKALSS